MGDGAQSPIPNPQIPNPQSPFIIIFNFDSEIKKLLIKIKIKIIFILLEQYGTA
jgi:hypothetical protein